MNSVVHHSVTGVTIFLGYSPNSRIQLFIKHKFGLLFGKYFIKTSLPKCRFLCEIIVFFVCYITEFLSVFLFVRLAPSLFFFNSFAPMDCFSLFLNRSVCKSNSFPGRSSKADAFAIFVKNNFSSLYFQAFLLGYFDLIHLA